MAKYLMPKSSRKLKYLSALFNACASGDLEVAQDIIGRGRATVDSRTQFEQTPLHVAATHGHIEIAKFLLTKGAKINARNWTDATPLMEAVRSNQYEMAKLLLEKGADINAIDLDKDESAVMLACRLNHAELALLLLQHRAVVTHPDKQGNTALHYACFHRNVALVDKLLEKGEKVVNLTNKRGKTPLLMTRNEKTIDSIELHAPWEIFVKLARAGSDCVKVDSLNLSSQKITNLDGATIASFKGLKKMDLRNNLLDSLPMELARLPSLESVKLKGNPLGMIPRVFRACAVKETLVVTKSEGSNTASEATHSSNTNPMVTTSEEPSWEKIKDYLLTLSSGSVPWKERKLVLVGQEGVGKSTLLRCFQEKRHKTDTSHNISTEGVEIQRGIKLSDDVTLSVWDFGGQVVFYPTHQFFLTPNSLFFVVFDLSAPDYTRLEYWMNTIRNVGTTAHSAPTYIVGTHLDSPVCTVEHEQMIRTQILSKFPKYRFPMLRGVHFVSCAKGTGIQELLNDIAGYVKETAQITLINPSWVIFHHYLQNQSHLEMIEWNYYIKLGVYCGLPKDQIPLCTEFLRDVGTIIHFDEPNLQMLVILSPMWLSKVMASLITFKHSWVKEGSLPMSYVSQVFAEFSPDLHQKLLALLEKFAIIFFLDPVSANGKIDEKERRIIVPSLLPASPPLKELSEILNEPLAECQVNGRVYEFDFLPLGFFSRLMVSLLHFPDVKGRLFWRDGIILQHSCGQIAYLSYDSERFQLQWIIRTSKKLSSSLSWVGSFETAEKSLTASAELLHRTIDPKEQVVAASKSENQDVDQGVGNRRGGRTRKFNKTLSRTAPQHSFARDSRTTAESSVTVLRTGYSRGDSRTFNTHRRSSSDEMKMHSFSDSSSTQGSKKEFSKLINREEGSPSVVEPKPHINQLSMDDSFLRIPRMHSKKFTTSSFSKTTVGKWKKNKKSSNMSKEDKRSESGARLQKKRSTSNPEQLTERMSDSSWSGKPNVGKDRADIGQSVWEVVVAPPSPSTFSFTQSASVHNFALHRAIVETVEMLIECYYPKLKNAVRKLIPCSHCLITSVPREFVYCFTEQEVVHAITESRPFLYCNNIRSVSRQVRVDLLAPDLALLDVKVLNANNLTLTTKLGEGGFGTVYRGVYEGKQVAVKELKLASEDMADEKFGEFQREVWVMSNMDHPNLTKLYGITLNPLRMVMEFCSCGDLYRFLHPKKTVNSDGSRLLSQVEESSFPWPLRYAFALDLAYGIRYMQSIYPPIIHRDFRSPNVFLKSLSLDDPVRAQIADFGLSRMVAPKIQGLLQTWQWLAPEVIDANAGQYDARADIYSLGIVYWEIATAGYPFDSYCDDPRYADSNGILDELRVKRAIISDNLRPVITDKIPPKFADLIRACWDGAAEKRPSADQIVQTLLEITGKEDIDKKKDKKHYIGSCASTSSVSERNTNTLVPFITKSLEPSGLLRRKLSCTISDNPQCLANINSQLWIGCFSGRILVLDEKLELVKAWIGHQCRIRQLLLLNNKVWSCSDDGYIQVWNVKDFECIHGWAATSKGAVSIKSICYVPSITRPTVWSALGESLRVWDIESYSLLHNIGVMDIDKDESILYTKLALHGNYMWVVGTTNVRIFNVNTLEYKGKFCAGVSAVSSIFPFQNKVWLGCSLNILLWEANEDEGELNNVNSMTLHSSGISGICGNKKYIFSSSGDGRILLWDPYDCKAVDEILMDGSKAITSICCNDNQLWASTTEGLVSCWE